MLKRFFLALSAVLALSSCSGHFISDREYRNAVLSDFSSRAALLEKAGVDLPGMDLTPDEREAMVFMYAYMPLGDMVNMAPEYWLQTYRLAR